MVLTVFLPYCSLIIVCRSSCFLISHRFLSLFFSPPFLADILYLWHLHVQQALPRLRVVLSDGRDQQHLPACPAAHAHVRGLKIVVRFPAEQLCQPSNLHAIPIWRTALDGVVAVR